MAKQKIRLPDEKTTPLNDMLAHTYLIFGSKKIGKSSLMARFPDTFFLPTEKGLDLQSVFQPVDEDNNPIVLRDWLALKKWARLACRDGRYSAICIDTIDQAYRLAFKYICDREGIRHPQESEWGKAWGFITDEMIALIEMIALDYDLGLFMLSHTASKTIERFDGEIEVFQASLGGKTGEYITGAVAFWAYYGYKGKQRRLWLAGSDGLDAGTRFENNFLDAETNEPLEYIPMGNSPDEAYENFTAAFNNEIELERKEKRTSRRRKKSRRRKRD